MPRSILCFCSNWQVKLSWRYLSILWCRVRSFQEIATAKPQAPPMETQQKNKLDLTNYYGYLLFHVTDPWRQLRGSAGTFRVSFHQARLNNLYIYPQDSLQLEDSSSFFLPAALRNSSISQESTSNMKLIASVSLLGMVAAAGAQLLEERQAPTNATVV